MAKKKSFFKTSFGSKLMNIIYGVAAAIVIVGALFKILHLEGATEMLMVGMGVEAGVFLVSAFDFPDMHTEYEWERVYPQLSEGYDGPVQQSVDTSGLSAGLANLDTGVFGKLGTTLSGLNDQVGKLSSVTDAAGATNEYAAKVKAASANLGSLSESYGQAVSKMSEFAKAAPDGKVYADEVAKVTSNLKQLNSIYELEFQNAKTHLKSINDFHGSLAAAMSSMSDAAKDAEAYKTGMSALAGNITKLNKVYGNMLSAMAGGVS
jgi:gliding motility-associated protein GldL